MSTRYARIADKELNDKHTRILVELLRRPENKTCADCKKKDPRWASWNLGLFVCIRCSGIHRSLGTHISKVKSVDLDTWTVEQVENMLKWGNQRANIYWEANLNGGQPTERNMDVWIRAKYEQKLWVEKEDLPDPSEIRVDSMQEEEKDILLVTKNEELVAPGLKNLSKEFGLIYHKSVKSRFDDKKNNVTIIEPSVIKKPAIQQPNQTNSITPTNRMTSSGFKIDMSLFQQQLSGLSLGRPSSDLIPQAPPGSDKSWNNFLAKQDTKSSAAAKGSAFK